MKAIVPFLLAASLAGCAPNGETLARPSGAPSIFLVRSTEKSPEAVVEAIERYTQDRKWPYFGADKAKQGEVTLVKFCIPEVAQQVWQAGLQVSAMLPCGNIGVYRKDGHTDVSLLHPRYMTRLYPDPAVEKASAIAEPLLTEMLDAVVR